MNLLHCYLKIMTKFKVFTNRSPLSPSNVKILIYYPILYETYLFYCLLKIMTKLKIFSNGAHNPPTIKYWSFHLLSNFDEILYLNFSWKLGQNFKPLEWGGLLPPHSKMYKSLFIIWYRRNFDKLWFTSPERHKPFASKEHTNGVCRSRDLNHLHFFYIQMVYVARET